MRRHACAGCGTDRLEVFLDLGATPLADTFPATPDEAEQRWPLEVAVCGGCRLVQLMEVVPDEVLWADYGFYSSTSPGLVASHLEYAALLLRRFGDAARGLVVEVGCNDGDLLRHFHAAGARVLGFDPARGPAAAAAARGLDVLPVAFTQQTAATVAADRGRADLLLASNVAAHVADPHDFMAATAAMLAPGGVAVVQVQYLADLLAGSQYDHVYHEHRLFYSVTSLAAVAAQHGLGLRSVEHVRAQGGSVRVVLAHGADRALAERWRRREAWLANPARYQALAGRVAYLRGELAALVAALVAGGRVIAGYGATAKSCTLLNSCGLDAGLLAYVEDTTPAKIGRYTPGTKIPIVAPGQQERPDVFLLLAWNYLAEIIRRERAFLDGGGRFLVPIPAPVLL